MSCFQLVCLFAWCTNQPDDLSRQKVRTIALLRMLIWVLHVAHICCFAGLRKNATKATANRIPIVRWLLFLAPIGVDPSIKESDWWNITKSAFGQSKATIWKGVAQKEMMIYDSLVGCRVRWICCMALLDLFPLLLSVGSFVCQLVRLYAARSSSPPLCVKTLHEIKNNNNIKLKKLCPALFPPLLFCY